MVATENVEGESGGSGRASEIPNRFIRAVLIVAGTLCVGLGALGIFLPLLPTTPFLLLAAACYARSSQRFYDWLLNNKYLGQYITGYVQRRGYPLRWT